MDITAPSTMDEAVEDTEVSASSDVDDEELVPVSLLLLPLPLRLLVAVGFTLSLFLDILTNALMTILACSVKTKF
jgi:hypothetical protein